MKRRFLLLSLALMAVILAVLLAGFVWLFETDSGLRWAYARLQKRVPGTLEIKTLDGTLAGPLRIGGLTYRRERVDLHIERAQLTWSPTALLAGRLQVDVLTVNDVYVRILDGPPRSTGTPKFGLPLNVGIDDLRVARIRFETSGGASQVVDTVDLAAFVGQEIVRIDRLKVAAPNFSVDASGALGLNSTADRSLHVGWRVLPTTKPSVAGSGTISGSLSHLTITQQLMEPIAADIRAEIREPIGDPQWQLHASVPEIDPSRLGLPKSPVEVGGTLDAHGGTVRYRASGTLHATAPDIGAFAGDFAISGTTAADEVVVDRLALRVPDTDTQLTAHAHWRPRDGTWTAAAAWQHLRWPLTADVAVLASPQGTIDVTGTRERYRGKLEFATTANKFPSARWRASASGDGKSVTFSDVAVDTLGSTVTGTAQVAWSPQLQWRTAFSGSALNPAVAWPEWPGALALKATLSGDRNELRADIASLRGRLRDQTFAAKASVVRRGESYPRFALDVTAGEAKINIAGALDRQWDLTWNLRAPDLAALIPNAAGNVLSNGRVAGARALPRMEVHLTADRFAYAGSRIRKASIDGTVDLADNTRSHVTVSMMQGALFNREFESLALGIDGFRSNHSITVDARGSQVELTAGLHGAYADNTWTGSITNSIARLGSEAWSLVGRPRIIAGTDRVQLAQTCWRRENTRACVKLSAASGEPTSVAVSTQELPLALIAPLLPNPPDWHGTVTVDSRMRFDGRRLTRADGHAEFSAGEVTLLDTAHTVFAYDRGDVRLRVNEQGLHANAEIALAGGGGGTAELVLPQFGSSAGLNRQPVSGRLSFEMPNLAPVAALFPQLEDLSGTLKMQFTVGGTFTDPRVRGEAMLTNGAARINATGVRIHDVRLAAKALGSDELRLSGEARAGPGHLNLRGRVIFPEDRAWRAELHIEGNQFQVADLRDNQIYVTPDLQVKLAPNEVVVDGSVRIPRAAFGLRTQKSDVVKPSPDIVLVNAPAEVPTPESRWKVIAQIRVVLGDQVTFSGFGLNATIAGDVALVEIPGQPATARGEVRVVKGRYEAYGQKLEVERGRLVFVGGPVSNPGIDARAVRKIEQITAGVEIKGTLREPQLSLFSDPAMSQSDALSYLVFGRPLEGASAEEGRSLAAAARALKLAGGERLAQRIGAVFGVEDVDIQTGSTNESASLVLGKQLSPRLYINYSIGLFTPTNVAYLKYKLSQRWSLEAQSGAQAGGDLIFSIEK